MRIWYAAILPLTTPRPGGLWTGALCIGIFGTIILGTIISGTGISATGTCLAGETVTLKQIMADPDWIGREPKNPVWSADSTQIFFQRKRKGSQILDWWVVDRTSGPKKLTLKQTASGLAARSVFDAKMTKRVYTVDGDVFVQTLASGKTRQLTRTAARESSPSFLERGDRIQFRRDNTIFLRDLHSGLESQPAVVRFAKPPAKPKEPTEFLTRKERELFEYLRRTAKASTGAKSQAEKLEAANDLDVDQPFYLDPKAELRRETLSPNANWLAIVSAGKESRKRGRRDAMPIWVKDDAYADSRDVRSLVGTDQEGDEKLTLLNLAKHETIQVDLSKLAGILDDPLAGLKNAKQSKTAAKSPDGQQPKKSAIPRQVNISNLRFSQDSRYLLFQCFSNDNKDRWICSIDLHADAAVAKTLHHRRDPAWINWRATIADWVGATDTVYFVSEATGYAHLYTVSAEGGAAKQHTKGDFEVSSITASRRGDKIFYRSNANHPGVYELNALDLRSGKASQLSSLGGVNDFVISPDETNATVLHSSLREPPELFSLPLTKPTDKPKRLTRFVSKQFREFDWVVPQIVEVPTKHGRSVYARLYLPKTPPKAERPAVVFVHGAGYLQNAHKGWSGYFREFMFHTLLTQRGYVVLDMDYRASAGYGRDWRTAIYRRMGTPELEDLKDGANWLVSEHQVDRRRVGVYGGSYGGFMTLMALFKEPDLFACGAALRPVTDWAHYNHSYTSNILNTPQVDPEAYELSSPIYFASGLKKPLVICHGMLDDNVFFKDTVRLTQKLIELEKENWQVAMYPVEPHGFRQPSSWLDEYRRVLQLFERHLKSPEQATKKR